MKLNKLIFIVIFLINNTLSASELKEENTLDFQLPNGMTFILVKEDSNPFFNAFVRIDVGSANEYPGECGISHLIEHLYVTNHGILKKCMADKYKNMKGLRIGGRTTRDFTSYFYSLPTELFKFWIEFEVMNLTSLSMNNLENVKIGIIEEIRDKFQNNNKTKLFTLFLDVAYINHPYDNLNLGWEHGLRQITEDQIEKYFYENYCPKNIVISIVGNFNLKQTEEFLKEKFSKIHSRNNHRRVPSEEPNIFNEKRLVVSSDDSKPFIFIGFRKSESSPFIDICFDIIVHILKEKLFENLVVKNSSALYIDIYISPGEKYPNLLVIESLTSTRNSPKELGKEILNEIKNLSKYLDPDLFENKRKEIKSNLEETLSSGFGKARELSYFQILKGNWRYLNEYFYILEQIKPQDIQKCVCNYLTEKNRIIAYVTNENIQL